MSGRSRPVASQSLLSEVSGQLRGVYWTKVQLDMTSTIRKITRRKRRNSNEHPIGLCLAAAMLLLDSCVEHSEDIQNGFDESVRRGRL